MFLLLFPCFICHQCSNSLDSFILDPTSLASLDDSESVKHNKSTCFVYKNIIHHNINLDDHIIYKPLADVNLERTKIQNIYEKQVLKKKNIQSKTFRIVQYLEINFHERNL